MQGYLSWDNKTIENFSDDCIENEYDNGFVFTRLGKGVMNQTRSLRINLEKFELSSENRRVLKHAENIVMNPLPLPLADYDWHIHKIGKDFYEKKFGEKTFSAQKIKELITGGQISNFNLLLGYRTGDIASGYCICLRTKNIFHYCYPFYDLTAETSNIGMGMMLKAILYAKDEGKKYFYLGSAQRPADIYKLQFAGLEWFDGKEWQTDREALKKIMNGI